MQVGLDLNGSDWPINLGLEETNMCARLVDPTVEAKNILTLAPYLVNTILLWDIDHQ